MLLTKGGGYWSAFFQSGMRQLVSTKSLGELRGHEEGPLQLSSYFCHVLGGGGFLVPHQ